MGFFPNVSFITCILIGGESWVFVFDIRLAKSILHLILLYLIPLHLDVSIIDLSPHYQPACAVFVNKEVMPV